MKLSVAYQGGARYDILSDRHRIGRLKTEGPTPV